MDIFLNILYATIPLVFGTIGYLFRTILSKIDSLDQKSQQFVTKQEVNQLINDKLEPIREDLTEIKQTLTRLYDFLLRKE